MARFFNPRIGRRDSSTGAGKTYLMRRVRIRTLVDTLDCLYRFGGEDFRCGIVRKNLAAANMPLLCTSDPGISGLVRVAGDGATNGRFLLEPAKSDMSIDDFIKSLDPDVLSFSEFIQLKIAQANDAFALAAAAAQKVNDVLSGVSNEGDQPSPSVPRVGSVESMLIYTLSTGEFITTWVDGVRRNVCEVIDDILSNSHRNDKWFVHVDRTRNDMPIFVFKVENCAVETVLPGAGDDITVCNFVRIRYVCKHYEASFTGTGVPRQVVLEGLAYPVIGGSVVSEARNVLGDFREVNVMAAYIDPAEATRIDSFLAVNNCSPGVYFKDDVDCAKLAYMLITNLVATVNTCMAVTHPENLPFAAVTDDAGEIVYSIASCRTLFFAIRKYALTLTRSLATVFTNTTLRDNVVSVVKNMRVGSHYFDLFKEWIVDPRGDLFIETLGQIWNRVSITETTLKSGMSSGINRAFDAATGNAVWALYVNRGDPDFDPVNQEHITGLESGLTYVANDGTHLLPYVSATHRLTDRDTSHVVLRYERINDHEQIIVFVDTPQEDKIRMLHIFLASDDDSLPCVTRFIGSVHASGYLSKVAVPDGNFADSKLMPRNTEVLDGDAVMELIRPIIGERSAE